MPLFLSVLVLALVQALTEFLPVSSSGHLEIAKSLCGMTEGGAGLDLFLHVGTLLAVVLFYRERVSELVVGLLQGRRRAWRWAFFVLVSMIPAFAAYAFVGDTIKALCDGTHTREVGILLLVNAAILVVGEILSRVLDRFYAQREARNFDDDGGDREPENERLSAWRALAMGAGQAVAMLPGVSRSGTSIAAGRLAGLGPRAAAEFSFLMSIPVIAGAALLECRETLEETGSLIAGVPLWTALAGTVVAGVVGYAALALLVHMLERGKFWIFALWCVLVGTLTLYYTAP